jgi:hypothetical protein
LGRPGAAWAAIRGFRETIARHVKFDSAQREAWHISHLEPCLRLLGGPSARQPDWTSNYKGLQLFFDFSKIQQFKDNLIEKVEYSVSATSRRECLQLQRPRGQNVRAFVALPFVAVEENYPTLWDMAQSTESIHTRLFKDLLLTEMSALKPVESVFKSHVESVNLNFLIG